MDKLEYIPRDLVSIYVGVKKYIVEIIGTKNENETLLYQIKFTNGEIKYTDKDNIVPIPITPYILEKNGWEKDEEASFKTQLYYRAKGMNRSIVIIIRKDTLRIVYNCICLKIIQYIHELQHILFGLGLNSEMEV